jgi:hypothetical protein
MTSTGRVFAETKIGLALEHRKRQSATERATGAPAAGNR